MRDTIYRRRWRTIDTLLPGKAGGTVAVRRTLASTICRIADPTQASRPRQLRDAPTVMRFQPAHQSMINRRFNDHASCLARKRLKAALARKPRFYSPAPGNDGHESGEARWPDSRPTPRIPVLKNGVRRRTVYEDRGRADLHLGRRHCARPDTLTQIVRSNCGNYLQTGRAVGFFRMSRSIRSRSFSRRRREISVAGPGRNAGPTPAY